MADMHENDPIAVWDIVKKIGVTMVVTHVGADLDGRPLQAYPDHTLGLIYFMTDSQRVLDQVAADARVMLNFADKGSNNYVSITGTAVIENDRAKIKELWTVWAEAFWESPEDPRIRLLVVTPEHARYWDGPNAVVTTIAMIAGAVTGKQPKLGDAGEVDL